MARHRLDLMPAAAAVKNKKLSIIFLVRVVRMALPEIESGYF